MVRDAVAMRAGSSEIARSRGHRRSTRYVLDLVTALPSKVLTTRTLDKPP